MTLQYSFHSNATLFPLTSGGSAIGTLDNVVAVTSAYQKSAVGQIAEGIDPFIHLEGEVREEIALFIEQLDIAGFLNTKRGEIQLPKRSMSAISTSDAAINQLLARAKPERAQSEWIDVRRDGGASTLARRATPVVELAGRSRVISIIYSLLLASGVARVRLADHLDRPVVTNLDLGCGVISPADLGGNYYEISRQRRREISLFPVDVELEVRPDLIIHSGEIDPELLIEWGQKKIPHLLIHPAVGDGVVIGPLVIPSQSPCNRCLSLYEMDNFGFATQERINLAPCEELPIVAAHFIASLLASQILDWIDRGRAGIGEITYINFQRLNQPQVVAITRHPLCGCDR